VVREDPGPPTLLEDAVDSLANTAAHPRNLERLAELLSDPRGVRDLAGALRGLAVALEAMAAKPAATPPTPRREPGLPGY
jgi:hypothetical protein